MLSIQRENGNGTKNTRIKRHLQIDKSEKKMWLSGRLHIEGLLNEGPRLQRKHKDENEAKHNKDNTKEKRHGIYLQTKRPEDNRGMRVASSIEWKSPSDTSSVYVCVVITLLILDVILLADAPAGVTQEEGHTGFFRLPSSAVLALIFLARRIQLSLSLVDRDVLFCVPTN